MTDPRCAWHEGDTGWRVRPDESPYDGCAHCGRLLDTRMCEGCGLTFLNWENRSFDDVLSGPAVTSSGDVLCIPCADADAEEEERAKDLYADGWMDDYP